MSVSEVQTLCGDPQARVSPLLCLTQTPSIQFLQPVKVQVPLPSGVTGPVCPVYSSCACLWCKYKKVPAPLSAASSLGHTVDMSCLHLLHGDPAAQTWTDITSQVSLYVTHLYAIFYITHFSW